MIGAVVAWTWALMAVALILVHERIQSMYVAIGTPATSVGYSVSRSKGSTWVVGRIR